MNCRKTGFYFLNIFVLKQRNNTQLIALLNVLHQIWFIKILAKISHNGINSPALNSNRYRINTWRWRFLGKKNGATCWSGLSQRVGGDHSCEHCDEEGEQARESSQHRITMAHEGPRARTPPHLGTVDSQGHESPFRGFQSVKPMD